MPEAIISAKGTEAPTVRSGRFTCETLAGCPSDKLPEDRTPATWVQGDRYVKGWILVDNNKVSLAGSHGILLTSKES